MDDQVGSLPLREPTFFILLSLHPGPRHGYGILKEVGNLSDGRIRLSSGTLYGAIQRMLESSWIERVDDPEPVPDARGRKAYVLTDLGHRVLQAEVERLQKLVRLFHEPGSEPA